MTSWLTRASPLRSSLGRRSSRTPSLLHDVHPEAAFHSFIKHWQQTTEILSRTRLRGMVSADDVTAVINHLGQMVNLLLVDLRAMLAHNARPHNGRASDNSDDVHQEGQQPTLLRDSNVHHYSLPADDPPHTPIFDHFLGEEILDKVLTWSLATGEYVNALKLEQLKIHEQLLSHSRHEILVYKPIIRPLLRLLSSCGGCVPVEVEKRLVVLLNQLCVSLMHNHQLLDFFFTYSDDQGNTKFLIFSLLLPFIHREGGIGQQARDALLLCMALSSTHVQVGQYIAQHSTFCPVLAAGLSGLYSTLPRSLEIESDGWHRLGTQDLSDIPQLQNFLNSLEFCNAVVQVGHPMVRTQLVEFLYQGFLVPVLGPALYQSVVNEVVAATAYVELCLRTVTEVDLRRAFLAFLLIPLEPGGHDPPLITTLISRLHSPNAQLCMVTLSLFLTLVDLNCEDVMVSLVFQYLAPCTHVMLSQRSRLTQTPDPASRPADRLLQLIPAVCQTKSETSPKKLETECPSSVALKSDDQSTASSIEGGEQQQHGSVSSCSSCSSDPVDSSELTPYSQYLLEAKMKVTTAHAACSSWTWSYDGLQPTPTQAIEMLEIARSSPQVLYPKLRSHSDPSDRKFSNSSLYNAQNSENKVRSISMPVESLSKNYSGCEKDKKVAPVLNGNCDRDNVGLRIPGVRGLAAGEEETLDSLGESSGYESFNIRVSRDSSPVHSNQGSQVSCQSKTGSNQGSPVHNRNKLGSIVEPEEDQEFLATLQRSQTPTDMAALEETLGEIEEAFSTFGIFDISSPALNQMMCGLETFADEDIDSPLWLSHSSSPSDVQEKLTASPDNSPSRPTIGPFLEALMLRIDQMLSSSIYVNLLVTTVISRLAAYPTPLLASLLLDASIVFQPSVRSLVQILTGLKQRLDAVLTPDETGMILEARSWYATRLITARLIPLPPATPPTPTPIEQLGGSFVRGEGKRRSLSQTVTSLFRRTTGIDRPSIKESPLENLPDNSGYRYRTQRSSSASVANIDISSTVIQSAAVVSNNPVVKKKHAARCAVLLRDWLMELAALAQEQTVSMPFLEYNFPSS